MESTGEHVDMLVLDDTVNEYFFSDEESDERKKTVANKPGKRGRRENWPDQITTDLIDIILNDENLNKKLLLTNVKTVKKWPIL